jgi:hypothetical protein
MPAASRSDVMRGQADPATARRRAADRVAVMATPFDGMLPRLERGGIVAKSRLRWCL